MPLTVCGNTVCGSTAPSNPHEVAIDTDILIRANPAVPARTCQAWRADMLAIFAKNDIVSMRSQRGADANPECQSDR